MHVAIVRIPAGRVAYKKLAHVARHFQFRCGRSKGMPGCIIETHPVRKLGSFRYTLPERPQTGEGCSIEAATEDPRAVPVEPCKDTYRRLPQVDGARAGLGRRKPPDASCKVDVLPSRRESLARTAAGEEKEAECGDRSQKTSRCLPDLPRSSPLLPPLWFFTAISSSCGTDPALS